MPWAEGSSIVGRPAKEEVEDLKASSLAAASLSVGTLSRAALTHPIQGVLRRVEY